MQILVTPQIILEALLNRDQSSGNIEGAWQALRVGDRIQGCLSERGLEHIHIDLRCLANAQTAQRVLSEIQTVFKICPIGRSVMDRARGSQIADYDAAVEVACAEAMRLDAILTQKARDFRGAALSLLVLEELSNPHQLKDFLHSENLPLLLVGNLPDLKHLECLLSPPVHLRQWLRNIFDLNWQPIEELMLS